MFEPRFVDALASIARFPATHALPHGVLQAQRKGARRSPAARLEAPRARRGGVVSQVEYSVGGPRLVSAAELRDSRAQCRHVGDAGRLSRRRSTRTELSRPLF